MNSLDTFFARRDVPEAARKKFYTDASGRYGFVYGVILVLTGWGMDAWQMANASAGWFWLKLIIVTIGLLPLNTLAGWLGGHPRVPIGWKLGAWIVLGGASGGIGLWLSFAGVSGIAALIDPALHGILVYPFAPAAQERLGGIIAFGAFFGLLAGAFENLAVAWAWERSSQDHRFTRGSWAMLCLGAPIALTLGALFDGTANAQMRAPYEIAHRIVQFTLTTPADTDYHKMPTMQMLDFLATSKWRDSFSPRYLMRVVDFDRAKLQTTYVDVEFDQGFIWRCASVRNGDNLTECVDLRTQYADWFTQFLRTGIVQCNDCAISIAPTAIAWHVRQPSTLGAPSISLTPHFGGVTVMRADYGASGAVECRFVGAAPTIIQDCTR